jgi:hypothetical protein
VIIDYTRFRSLKAGRLSSNKLPQASFPTIVRAARDRAERKVDREMESGIRIRIEEKGEECQCRVVKNRNCVAVDTRLLPWMTSYVR